MGEYGEKGLEKKRKEELSRREVAAKQVDEEIEKIERKKRKAKKLASKTDSSDAE
mgnify:CR=1 FL=1